MTLVYSNVSGFQFKFFFVLCFIKHSFKCFTICPQVIWSRQPWKTVLCIALFVWSCLSAQSQHSLVLQKVCAAEPPTANSVNLPNWLNIKTKTNDLTLNSVTSLSLLWFSTPSSFIPEESLKKGQKYIILSFIFLENAAQTGGNCTLVGNYFKQWINTHLVLWWWWINKLQQDMVQEIHLKKKNSLQCSHSLLWRNMSPSATAWLINVLLIIFWQQRIGLYGTEDTGHRQYFGILVWSFDDTWWQWENFEYDQIHPFSSNFSSVIYFYSCLFSLWSSPCFQILDYLIICNALLSLKSDYY